MRMSAIVLAVIGLNSIAAIASNPAQAEGGSWLQTPYREQKVLFDFYFGDPNKINIALYWIRAQMNPLIDEHYNQAPALMQTVVIIHGTEIVTVARKNYDRFKDAAERMR